MEVFWYSSKKKNLLLFDSFGFVGSKQFIVDNDKNTIDRMLFNLEKFNKKDAKINLVSLKLKNIKEKSLDILTNAAKDFFHLPSEFGKLKKQKKEMKIILLNDQLLELRVKFFSYIFIRISLILSRDSNITEDESLTKKQ